MLQRIKTRLTSLFRRERYERELDSRTGVPHRHAHGAERPRRHAPGGGAHARRSATSADRPRERRRARYVAVAALGNARAGRPLRPAQRVAAIRGSPSSSILTMALGIGANTAIFSVVNGVLLRPLPFRDGEQLVVLRQQQPLAGRRRHGFLLQGDPRLPRRRRASTASSSSTTCGSSCSAAPSRNASRPVSCPRTSSTCWASQPLYGRNLHEADDAPGAPAVLVLSHKYWKRSFGGDPTVVGKVFQMNDRPHQVVGILPPVPQYPLEVDVYMPTSACPFRSSRAAVENRNFRIVRRPSPG